MSWPERIHGIRGLARSYSECEVLQQDFLAMKLPESRFDGIFVNASLFRVPGQELPRVVAKLSATLRFPGCAFLVKPERKRRGRLRQ